MTTVISEYGLTAVLSTPELEYLLPACYSNNAVVRVKDFYFQAGVLEMKCLIQINSYTMSGFRVKVETGLLKIYFSPTFGIEFLYQRNFKDFEHYKLVSVVSYFANSQAQEAFRLVLAYIDEDIDRIITLYNSVIISKYLTNHPYSQFRIVKNTNHRELTIQTLGHELNIWFSVDSDGVNRVDVSSDKDTLMSYFDGELGSTLTQLADIETDWIVYDIDNSYHRQLASYINLIAKILLLYSRRL